MPTVPRYDTPTVEQNTRPLVALNGFDAPTTKNFAIEEGQQAMAGVQNVSNAAMQFALDKQTEANQLRVDEAINKATDERLRLTYDKETGFTSVKGDAVMTRQSNKPLADEYLDTYKKSLTDIAGSLGNDAQRQAFAAKSQQMLSAFHGDALQHEVVEYKNHQQSVYKGTIDSRTRQIALEYRDDKSVAESVNSIYASSYALSKSQGKSAIEADEMARTSMSGGHVVAIESALKSGDIEFANKYFNAHKTQISIGHLPEIDSHINQATNLGKAQAATDTAHASFQAALNPDSRTRLHGVVEMLESGGRRYDKSGKLLSNPESSAKGEMQVLDGTAKAPGLGVKPAQDDSPGERARVGHDYLDALLLRYGRVDQATAAYKWGYGNVDAAIAKAKNPKNETGGDWYSFLDTPTKEYLAKAQKMMDSGMGAPTRPSELQFVETAVVALGQNARPEQIKTTTEAAKQRFTLIEQDRKQRQDAIYTDVQKRLIANGGTFEAVPVGMLNQVDPDQREKLRKFAEEEKKGPAKVTDDGVYYRLSQMPAEEFAKVNLLDYRHQLADGEFKGMVMRQQNIGKSNAAEMAKDHNLKTELKLIEGQLTGAGIFLNASEKQASRIEQRDKFMGELNRLVETEEKGTGKPVKGDRVRQIASGMLTKVAGDPGATMFKDNDFAWKLMTRAYEDIPGNQRKTIEQVLRSQGATKIDRSMIVDAWKKNILQTADAETKKRNAL